MHAPSADRVRGGCLRWGTGNHANGCSLRIWGSTSRWVVGSEVTYTAGGRGRYTGHR